MNIPRSDTVLVVPLEHRDADRAQQIAEEGGWRKAVVWPQAAISSRALARYYRSASEGPLEGWTPYEVHPTVDLIGVAEVARITGLSEASIRTYKRRRTLPAPISVEGSPALVWSRAEIEEWARTRPGPGRPVSLGRDHPWNGSV